MKHVPLYSLIFLTAGLFLIGACIADTAGDKNLSILALEEKDLSSGYVIISEFSPLLLNETCKEDFCLLNGGSIAIEKTADSGNVSVDQNIMVYSQPITKDLLIRSFHESYPELSQWNIGEQIAPEIGNVSIAFNYTVPENIGPKDPALTGYVIAFGTGDVYEVFKSTGGSLEDLKEVSEIGAEKLQSALKDGIPVWKPSPVR